MDQLGTYRGYDIAGTLHSNGERKVSKWQSSIQISPICKAATERCFSTEPSYSTVSGERNRAIRIAREALINSAARVPAGAAT